MAQNNRNAILPLLAALAMAMPLGSAQANPAPATPAVADPPIVTIFGSANLGESATADYRMFQIFDGCSDNFSPAAHEAAFAAQFGNRIARSSADRRSFLSDMASFSSGPDASRENSYNDWADRLGRPANRRSNPFSRVSSGCDSAANFAAGMAYIRLTDTSLQRAMSAYHAKRYEEAAKLFEESYDKIGYDRAGLMLGNMYLKGQGVPRDTGAAVKWYDRVALSASANQLKVYYSLYNPQYAPISVQARVLLANMYVTGNGVPKDAAKARRWYRLADDNDYLPARYVYARMLETGYGGSADPDKAIRLYRSAAEYGYGPAQYRLAQLYAGGAGVPADMSEARTWFERAAFNPGGGASKARAQAALAELYDRGETVAADPRKALALYRYAATAGDPNALNALATYFYNGEAVAQDKPLSRKLFLEAATRGNAEAMVNGAVMLFKGEGGEPDAVQAYAWLLVAERAGAPRARQSMGSVAASLTPEQRAKAEAIMAPGARQL